MTPKEKAIKLMQEYVKLHPYNDTIEVRKCALIAVDEIINVCLPSSEYGGVITDATIEYWQEVKQEIEKL
jgi:hypothetical protein